MGVVNEAAAYALRRDGDSVARRARSYFRTADFFGGADFFRGTGLWSPALRGLYRRKKSDPLL
jgi:hypothetical protein